MTVPVTELYTENFDGTSPLDNWDGDDVYVVISGTRYVSSPSSLCFEAPTSSIGRYLLARDSSVQNVPDGSLEAQMYSTLYTSQNGFLFRNQTTLGTGASGQGYRLLFANTDDIWLIRDPGPVTADSAKWTRPINQWLRLRAVFYTGLNGAGATALVCIVQYYTGGAWTDIATLYDTQNLYATSTLNRVGLQMYSSQAGQYAFVDDFVSSTAGGPSDAMARVTGIRHLYRPGSFKMILNLGEVDNSLEISGTESPKPVVQQIAELEREVQGIKQSQQAVIQGGLWFRRETPTGASDKITAAMTPTQQIGTLPEPSVLSKVSSFFGRLFGRKNE